MKPMTKEQREKLGDRLVVASVSGGKDSAALALWLKENEVPHRRVFADTGWEHGSTYEYLRGPLTKALGPIDEVGLPGGMAGLIEKKGMFPARLIRFCTKELKVAPIAAYVRALQDEVGETVNAVGIRAAESASRAKLTEWEWSDAFDAETWRPLIGWTEADVIEMHRRHGLAPNPLYLLGATRVGCFPCIAASKPDIKLVADLAPERIEEIRRLEEATTAAAQARNANAKPRTFFHGKLSRAGLPVSIADAVAWSRTGKGGRQWQLFEEEQSDGCVRWGLCESGGTP